MKRGVLGMVLALAALAGAGGVLEHVGPVADGVAGETALLAPCEPVGCAMPEVLPLARAEVLGFEVAEDAGFGGLAQRMTLAWLPGYGALAGVAEAVAGGAPAYAALAGSAEELRVSPLLGPLDVWGEGPLGVLAREALAALDAGDVRGYLEKASDYWLGMEQALKRREAHKMGARRSGSGAELGP